MPANNYMLSVCKQDEKQKECLCQPERVFPSPALVSISYTPTEETEYYNSISLESVYRYPNVSIDSGYYDYSFIERDC